MPENHSGQGDARALSGTSPFPANGRLDPELSATAAVILRNRARAYARVDAEEVAGDRIEVLSFRLGGEEYAAELRLLRGVVRANGLSPVPCTPALVAGVLNVRGAIVSVLDLAAILGLESSTKLRDTSQVVLVEASDGLVGLLVDEVQGAFDLALDALDESLSGRESVRGVANSKTVVLDIEKLLADDRFTAVETDHQFVGV